MKYTTLFLLTAGALLGACSKSATVQGEPVKKTETTTTRKEAQGADYDKSETKVVTKQTELPTKLTLNKPSGPKLERGGTAKVDVKIKRENLTGDVTFRFENLPAGVEVIDSDQRLVGDTATFTLRASESAGLMKDFQAQVTAVGPDGLAVSQPLEITVIEKK